VPYDVAWNLLELLGKRMDRSVERQILYGASQPQRKEKDMLNKLKSRKGFTLIELLIVVAIIGILAAIAIPQFASYRIKSYNTATASDLKNAKTSLEAFYADNSKYP